MILVRNRMLKARNKQCPISPEMDGRNLQHLRFVRGLWHIYLWWKWRVSHGFTIWNWEIYSTPVAIKFMGQIWSFFFPGDKLNGLVDVFLGGKCYWKILRVSLVKSLCFLIRSPSVSFPLDKANGTWEIYLRCFWMELRLSKNQHRNWRNQKTV